MNFLFGPYMMKIADGVRDQVKAKIFFAHKIRNWRA